MDGSLDAGAELLADGDGLTLWGARQGDLLYLATEGLGETTGLDHFIFVLSAKSGNVLGWDFYLGAEDSNGWFGWFDAASNVVTGPEYSSAQGTVLEGLLDLGPLYGNEVPDSLWIAATGYDNPDAGLLLAKAPAGDGDGDLEAAEYYLLWSHATGVDTAPSSHLSVMLFPNPFNPEVRLTVKSAEGPLRVEVFDIEGRRITSLYRGVSQGDLELRWDGRDARGHDSPSGVYLFRVNSKSEWRSVKGILLK